MNEKVSESLGRLNLATPGDSQIDTVDIDASYRPSFLRLPAELRVMIYEHVFANETIHVQPKSTDPLGGSYLLRHGVPKYQQVFSLLVTCRHTRREATPTFNDLVTFDLTLYYNCMAAAYELGPRICQKIRAIKVEPRLAKRLALGLQQGAPPSTNYRHLLPSLQRVHIQQTSIFGLLMMSPDMAVRALRLYFGHSSLEVIFSRKSFISLIRYVPKTRIKHFFPENIWRINLQPWVSLEQASDGAIPSNNACARRDRLSVTHHFSVCSPNSVMKSTSKPFSGRPPLSSPVIFDEFNANASTYTGGMI